MERHRQEERRFKNNKSINKERRKSDNKEEIKKEPLK